MESPTPLKHSGQPRLLYVVNVDWFFLSHRLPLAVAAREAGFDVHVATALTGPATALSAHGLTVHPIKLDRQGGGLWEAALTVYRLGNLMRRLRPSVVHLVTIKPVLFGGIAARLTGVPLTLAAISGLGFVFVDRGLVAQLRRWCVAQLYRLAINRPGVLVIFQNADDRRLLMASSGLPQQQTFLVNGSGVDLTVWTPQPLPHGLPIVMLAARLLRDKGVREFAAAARMLRGRARFVLVGDVDRGNPSSLLPQEVQGWVDEGSVEWWGHKEDMPTTMAQAHLVVLPSYREGFPKVLMEAAAAGRAVVTTDVPGCRDAVLPGVTGLLVPPRDAMALAVAIGSLIGDQEKLQGLGLAGRRHAEQSFSVQTVIDAHLAAYRQGGAIG